MQYTDVAYIVYSTPVQHRCARCQTQESLRQYIALCLLDHHVIGTGATKDLALYRMMEGYRAKYEPASPPLRHEPSFSDDDDDEGEAAGMQMGGFFA